MELIFFPPNIKYLFPILSVNENSFISFDTRTMTPNLIFVNY